MASVRIRGKKTFAPSNYGRFMDDFDKSRFLDYFLLRNNLSPLDFKRWLFAPGMLFKDKESWWPGGRPRLHPHEGVDLRQFVDRHGQVHSLTAKTVIPAMYDGTVIDIFDDFLGKSILLAHGPLDQGLILHAIYGHIAPAAGLAINDTVREGEPLATLAATGKSDIPPHLHLSILLMARQAGPGEIRWESINDFAPGGLVDPLAYV